jgi:excisionase family DNA binding protein
MSSTGKTKKIAARRRLVRAVGDAKPTTPAVKPLSEWKEAGRIDPAAVANLRRSLAQHKTDRLWNPTRMRQVAPGLKHYADVSPVELSQLMKGQQVGLRTRAKKRRTFSPTADYFRTTEAAKYLEISVRTLRRWIRSRKIPYRRVGKMILFRRVDLDEALKRYEVRAVGS